MTEIPIKLRALSLPRFCKDYSTGRSSAYAAIASGKLIAVKNGRRTLIPVESADAWLASLPTVPVTKPSKTGG